MLKTYQLFKTGDKGDSHSSKTGNIILPGLMIKQRWTSLYVCNRNGIHVHWPALCWLKQLISPKLNSLLFRFLLTFLLTLTMALSRVVSEIFNVEKYRDLEIRARSQSRSLKVVPFDRLDMVS